MEIEKVQKREIKSVNISVRTTKTLSKFMKDNNISPNKVFDEAVKELMKNK